MKKILLGSLLFTALFTACSNDDDYNAGIANPQASDPTVTQAFGNGSVTEVGVINLGEVTTETVKVAEIVLPTPTSETAKIDSMYVSFIDVPEGNDTWISTDGTISTEFFSGIIESLYGKRPLERSVAAVVSAFLSDGNQAFLINSDVFNVKAIPATPDIESAYYLTGSINGWDNTDTTYKLTNNGGDPYENPTFTCRIPAPADGSDVEFKMTPESGLGGDWSGCLAGGAEDGTFVYNNGGGNLVIQAVEGAKFYDLTFNMMDLTWSYKAVTFDPFVYFIGATDGWANADQRLAAVEDGIYTGYLYVADPNGWGLEFKFQLEQGNWDKQLNSNNLSEINGDFEKGDDNIKAGAGEGVYYVTLDLNTNVLSATKVTNMNLVGDFNGWNQADDAQQMTWDAENYCYVIENAGVTANGWKFTTNNAWEINLGGTIDNLWANGDNLTVEGKTIKLYPTRKDNDNIYCTVE